MNWHKMCGAASQGIWRWWDKDDNTGMMKKGKTEVWDSDKQEKTQPKLEIRPDRWAEGSEP